MSTYFISLFLLLLLPRLYESTSTQVKSLDELKTFFETTTIQRETGYLPENVGSKKAQYAPGFHASWSLYHFHHVCIRGGTDGIYTGIQGVPPITQPSSEFSLTSDEWNEFIGSRFNSPMSAFTLDEAHFNIATPPTIYHNSTLYANCNRQHSMSFNPSHFMMNIGYLYEMGNCILKNLGRARVFKYDIQLPFKQLVMHQCPDPEKSRWHWGQTAMDVINEKLEEAFVIKKNHSITFRIGKESTDKQILCFDDIYLSARSSHWLEGYENSIGFRRAVAEKTGEPVDALKISERYLDFRSNSMYQSYCTPGSTKPTSAKIKLFQRTENLYPRTIVNANDVIALLQSFTTQPVEIITTTEKMTIAEQARSTSFPCPHFFLVFTYALKHNSLPSIFPFRSLSLPLLCSPSIFIYNVVAIIYYILTLFYSISQII